MDIKRRGKGGIFHVRFTAPNGRRVRRSTGTTDRQEAQEFADRLKADLWRQMKLGERPRRTWQEAAVRFLRETKHKRTHDQDRAKLRWLDPYLGNLYVDQVDRDKIDASQTEVRRVFGGLLVQESDPAPEEVMTADVATEAQPTDEQRTAMEFAWRVVKHVKSNAIVFASHDRTLAIGGGVARNQLLRDMLRDDRHLADLHHVFPAPALCSDNGAMVAGLGTWLFESGTRDDLALRPLSTAETRG